ncbi:MAG: isoleucine--tRNA ligase [Cellvibrionaceae bacterium]
MTNYKDTLNLPKTAFPMKANLAQREPQTLKRWQKDNVYQEIRESRQGEKKFILHDGPPYANGNIHLGHAVNKTLKDIIVKSKTLSGFDSPYVPGWDCHGLPIEHQVEKKIGKAGVKVDYKTFRQKCREYATKQVEGQKKDFIRLGVFGDWDNPYLTMNHEFEADIIRALGKIAENGHLQKGFKPVYWSVVGGSALAEAEVEYQDKTSFSIDVKFEINNISDIEKIIPNLSGGGKLSVLIWTTTPWTLPSNQAVSVNPELDYVVVEVNGERLLFAEALLESVAKRASFEHYSLIGRCKGSALENIKVKHPFYDRVVPMILGDHVTTDAGTGCVHTAPDHGMDDFVVGKKYDIGTLNYVNANGVFRDDVELFAGQHVYKVDEPVIEILKEHQALLHQEKITHSFPHCWRTKTPLIFRATPQWFISLTQNNLLGAVKDAIKKVEWLPAWGEARIEGMVDSSPDWCISRQRTWGAPIALFVHKETQTLHPRTSELIEDVAKRVEKEGMDAWFESSAEEFLGDEAARYDKVTDTLDVWFDSGVTHYAVLSKRSELTYPADLYIEGSDQHRGWFQSSLKTAMAINGKPPYKEVMTYGFTVDENGRKMSKSLGNVIAPDDVTKELGADVLRLWIASTDCSSEMSVSKEILNRSSDSYRRIRNSVRYLLSNINDFDPATDMLQPSEMIAIDCWIMDKAAVLQDEIIALYDQYQFHTIVQKLQNFCSTELSSFYLDVVRDRQYTTQKNSIARRSAQTALYHVAEAFVRWITPILSFTADEIWALLPGDRSQTVFSSRWYELPRFQENETLSREDWQQLIIAKDAVNKSIETLRKAGDIGSALECEVTLYCDETWQKAFDQLGEELRFLLITSQVELESLSSYTPKNGEGNADVSGLIIVARKTENEKCDRCWHYLGDVGSHESHPTICSRCVENIEGDGEKRQFV